MAIKKCVKAETVLAASLLNNQAVAETIVKYFPEQTIILVCAGSSNRFALEDAYGAGHLITCLHTIHSFELTDASISAKAVYPFYEQQSLEVLKSSAVKK